MSHIVAGLDMGSSNIRAAVCRVSGKGEMELLALESIPSGGIDSGDVTDFNIAVRDIREVLKKLEAKINGRIKQVSATIGGSYVQSVEAHGMIALSQKPRQIWHRDVKRCIEIARMIRLPQDRQIIQEIVQSFYINERDRVADPLGVYATKLGVNLYVITADVSRIKNLSKCIEHSGYILDNVVFSTSAVFESIFPEENEGRICFLLDIGSHLTNIALFQGKRLKHINCLAKGAKDLNKAEHVQSYLQKIAHSLRKEEFTKVIFVGGGALKEDLMEMAENIFKVKCELGTVKLKWCSLNPSDSINHIASLGLCSYETKRLLSLYRIQNPIIRMTKFAGDMLNEYF